MRSQTYDFSFAALKRVYVIGFGLSRGFCIFGVCLVFGAPFFSFGPPVLSCVLQKAWPTSSLHFFNWFFSTFIFTEGFFWWTFSDFCFSSTSVCCKKHVLPLACIFFNWFLRANLFTSVLSDQGDFDLDWCKLCIEVQHLRGGRVRTTSSPPTP